MELALAIAALLVSVIGLPWLKGPIERAVMRDRVRKATARAQLRGVPPELSRARALKDGLSTDYSDDLMFCKWNHHVSVAANGDTKTTVDCVAVNVSDADLSEVRFPVYMVFDNESKLPTLDLWAKIGAMPLSLRPTEWDAQQNVGMVRIPFTHPLQPREAVQFSWGYSCPRLYDRSGRHWFEWYIARPHAYFRVAFDFDRAWTMLELVPSVVDRPEMPARAAIRRNGFRWLIKAPLPGCKYRLDWRLERASVEA